MRKETEKCEKKNCQKKNIRKSEKFNKKSHECGDNFILIVTGRMLIPCEFH